MKLPQISITNPIKKHREYKEFQKELDRPIRSSSRNGGAIPHTISVQTINTCLDTSQASTLRLDSSKVTVDESDRSGLQW
eukprot:scaffold99272_cov71-Cyclotella_meneghiniana.AAC.2